MLYDQSKFLIKLISHVLIFEVGVGNFDFSRIKGLMQVPHLKIPRPFSKNENCYLDFVKNVLLDAKFYALLTGNKNLIH